MFKPSQIITDDQILISKSLKGDRSALEDLIKKHQSWIYNVALNMLSNPAEAADVTQEVLIKVVTKLSTFKNESNFRTWMYRIVKNHFLNVKRDNLYKETLSFEDFGNGLDSTRDEDLSNYSFEVENRLLVKEAKLGCMKAMLLCLDPEQRLIFIVGELFKFSDTIGSEIMEISKVNFRKKLSLARKQLYNFMNEKCGLVNKKNPCRCARKTAGFIKAGHVDPTNLYFQRNTIDTIEKVLEQKTKTYSTGVISAYQQLYLEHPFLESPEGLESIRKLLSSKTIRETFNLG